MESNKRKKAFIGTAIAAGASLLGSAVSGIINARQIKKQNELAAAEANRQAMYQKANALSQVANEQDYVDEYKNKIVMKAGGKYNDRMKQVKRYACGGRKKAEVGTTGSNKGLISTDVVSGIINGATSLIQPVITNALSVDKTIPTANNFTTVGKTNTTDNGYYDRLKRYKCGGRKK